MENPSLHGLRIGKYTFRMKIGEGATSEVWKCEVSGQSPVAVKFVSSQRSKYSEIAKYTKGEYDFYKKHNSPFLLEPFNVHVDNRGYYLFFEYFEGPDLFHAFQHQRELYQPILEVYFNKMVLAMQFVHKHKTVHCDIKPENFLVDLEGNLKIIDFSIMKKVSDFKILNRFFKSKMEGTPEYMSPEQIRKKNISYESDIYSLGLVFYYLVTGKIPFKGNTHQETLHNNLWNELVEPIKVKRNNCCPVLNSLIKNMIMKDPKKRINNITEILLILRKCNFGSGSSISLSSV
ncbi:MAG: hypothetical protein COA79_00380 [Planctomycetota bacterium]|nr:MAG: hypothetical protein COA79_00380 [Planctomycetota bacterium]